jgi:hypothetical protein
LSCACGNSVSAAAASRAVRSTYVLLKLSCCWSSSSCEASLRQASAVTPARRCSVRCADAARARTLVELAPVGHPETPAYRPAKETPANAGVSIWLCITSAARDSKIAPLRCLNIVSFVSLNRLVGPKTAAGRRPAVRSSERRFLTGDRPELSGCWSLAYRPDGGGRRRRGGNSHEGARAFRGRPGGNGAPAENRATRCA